MSKRLSDGATERRVGENEAGGKEKADVAEGLQRFVREHWEEFGS